jgi:hypothetical protein
MSEVPVDRGLEGFRGWAMFLVESYLVVLCEINTKMGIQETKHLQFNYLKRRC